MMKPICILLALAMGCTDESFAIDVDHTGASAAIYDDGTNLVVTGCTDGAFLGCRPPGVAETMSVTVDGVAHDVPQTTAIAIDDQILGLFRDGPFKLAIASPADRQLGVNLAGAVTTVAMGAGFTVSVAGDHVSRAAGSITVDYQIVPNSHIDGLVITTCGSAKHIDEAVATTPGQLVVSFDRFTAADGGCTHEIHVDQTFAVDSAALPVDVIRIERVTVTSAP